MHVIYGLLGLKTHSKVALVVRREGEGIRRYIHLSTGNYNAVTAHLYEDLGIFTCDEEVGADVTDFVQLPDRRLTRKIIVNFWCSPSTCAIGLRRLSSEKSTISKTDAKASAL